MPTDQTSQYNVLVVDDNPTNIQVVGSILREHGYQMGFASDGLEALDILKDGPTAYDLVLLDVSMPEISGFEVCRRMRATPQLQELPVIFLTARTASEHVVEGFDSGGQDYVIKPFQSAELLARISTHIELQESRAKLQRVNTLLEKKVRERTRELEEANRELAALDKAKADFLSLISHEINTPLNGIINLAEFLSEELAESEFMELIGLLQESASRLQNFSAASLVLTTLRTAPERYHKAALDLSTPLEETLADHKGAMDLRGLSLAYTCTAERPLIYGDANLIQVCINELIRNAVMYTPAREHIAVALYREDGALVMEIENYGIILPPHIEANLFTPFATAASHIDENKGLGLALVKSIAEYHQAEVEVSNVQAQSVRVRLKFADRSFYMN